MPVSKNHYLRDKDPFLRYGHICMFVCVCVCVCVTITLHSANYYWLFSLSLNYAGCFDKALGRKKYI